MTSDRLTLVVDPRLWLFLPSSRRRGTFEVDWDGTSSTGHVVEAAGVPLTEVAPLPAVPDGHTLRVRPAERPQRPHG